MTKQQLRSIFQERRKALSSAEVRMLSGKIADHFFSSTDLTSVSILHTFLPIRKKNEPDTWIIVQRLRMDFPDIAIAVPLMNSNTGELEHFLLDKTGDVAENAFGIPEPRDAKPIASTNIDLVLTPLLAFDRLGNRVGYGRGFYDRFFQQCRPDAVRIGISLFEAADAIDDVNANDVRLHRCITPNGTVNF